MKRALGTRRFQRAASVRRIENRCVASPRLRAGSGAYPGRASRFIHRLQVCDRNTQPYLRVLPVF